MSQSTRVLPARHFDPARHLKEDVRDFLEGPWFDEAPLPGRGIDVKNTWTIKTCFTLSPSSDSGRNRTLVCRPCACSTCGVHDMRIGVRGANQPVPVAPRRQHLDQHYIAQQIATQLVVFAITLDPVGSGSSRPGFQDGIPYEVGQLRRIFWQTYSSAQPSFRNASRNARWTPAPARRPERC
jgi:hypothetical protein